VVALKLARRRRLFGLIPVRKPRRALTDDEIITENEQVKLNLRRRIGWFALLLTAAQVACADVVFIIYASLGMHWRVPTAAIQAWLAATVVQVIGIVLVIVRSLFPPGENGSVSPIPDVLLTSKDVLLTASRSDSSPVAGAPGAAHADVT
jgi:hypothetical protein